MDHLACTIALLALLLQATTLRAQVSVAPALLHAFDSASVHVTSLPGNCTGFSLSVLARDGSTPYQFPSQYPASQTVVNWPSVNLPLSSSYRVRLVPIGCSSAAVLSNFFHVIGAGTDFQVYAGSLDPELAEFCQQGSQLSISWSSGGLSGFVTLRLLTAATGTQVYNIKPQIVNSDTYGLDWTIPSTIPPGAYLVEMAWLYYPSASSTFVITAADLAVNSSLVWIVANPAGFSIPYQSPQPVIQLDSSAPINVTWGTGALAAVSTQLTLQHGDGFSSTYQDLATVDCNNTGWFVFPRAQLAGVFADRYYRWLLSLTTRDGFTLQMWSAPFTFGKFAWRVSSPFAGANLTVRGDLVVQWDNGALAAGVAINLVPFAHGQNLSTLAAVHNVTGLVFIAQATTNSGSLQLTVPEKVPRGFYRLLVQSTQYPAFGLSGVFFVQYYPLQLLQPPIGTLVRTDELSSVQLVWYTGFLGGTVQITIQTIVNPDINTVLPEIPLTPAASNDGEFATFSVEPSRQFFNYTASYLILITFGNQPAVQSTPRVFASGPSGFVFPPPNIDDAGFVIGHIWHFAQHVNVHLTLQLPLDTPDRLFVVNTPYANVEVFYLAAGEVVPTHEQILQPSPQFALWDSFVLDAQGPNGEDYAPDAWYYQSCGRHGCVTKFLPNGTYLLVANWRTVPVAWVLLGRGTVPRGEWSSSGGGSSENIDDGGGDSGPSARTIVVDVFSALGALVLALALFFAIMHCRSERAEMQQKKQAAAQEPIELVSQQPASLFAGDDDELSAGDGKQQDAILALRTGSVLTRIEHGGSLRRVFVYLDSLADGSLALFWSTSGARNKSVDSSLPLRSITEIVFAPRTPLPSSSDIDPRACFSILGADGTLLDLCASSHAQQQLWIRGLKEAISHHFRLYPSPVRSAPPATVHAIASAVPSPSAPSQQSAEDHPIPADLERLFDELCERKGFNAVSKAALAGLSARDKWTLVKQDQIVSAPAPVAAAATPIAASGGAAWESTASAPPSYSEATTAAAAAASAPSAPTSDHDSSASTSDVSFHFV